MGWTQRQARPAEPPTSRSEALASCTSRVGIGSIAASLLLRESSLTTLGRVLGHGTRSACTATQTRAATGKVLGEMV
jgi:hypothetical protein